MTEPHMSRAEALRRGWQRFVETFIYPSLEAYAVARGQLPPRPSALRRDRWTPIEPAQRRSGRSPQAWRGGLHA